MLKPVLCIVVLCFVGFMQCMVPDYIKPCKADDPEVSNCIINAVNELRPRLQKGIPEIDVPPIDPLHLDILRLTRGFQCNVTDVEVLGSSMFEITELEANIPDHQYRFKVSLPFLQFKGNYELNARILTLNLKGRGPMYGNFTDYNFEAELKGKRVQQDGEDYLKFSKIKLIINPGQAIMQIDNLFNGNVAVSKLVNDAINELGDAIFEVVRPALTETMSELFTDVANKITLRFKYDELFL